MAENALHSLCGDELMAHMQVLCQEIGPRPPTSPQERRAAAYVRDTLEALGLDEVQVQPFASQDSFGWVTIPATLAAVGKRRARPKRESVSRWGQEQA